MVLSECKKVICFEIYWAKKSYILSTEIQKNKSLLKIELRNNAKQYILRRS